MTAIRNNRRLLAALCLVLASLAFGTTPAAATETRVPAVEERLQERISDLVFHVQAFLAGWLNQFESAREEEGAKLEDGS